MSEGEVNTTLNPGSGRNERRGREEGRFFTEKLVSWTLWCFGRMEAAFAMEQDVTFEAFYFVNSSTI